MTVPHWRRRVVIRLLVAALIGTAVLVLIAATEGWRYASSAGWTAAAFVYLTWTWAVVLPMDPDQTREHVEPEDPPTGWFTDGVILSAAVASLAGVEHLLAAGSKTGTERNIAAAVGVVSIIAAWCVVHTVYSIRYADIYYSTPGRGINFNGTEKPRFLDFFYVGFTIGMTYQVSDTTLETGKLRRTALSQALLSYLLAP